jgi:hypothetical protein
MAKRPEERLDIMSSTAFMEMTQKLRHHFSEAGID